MMRIAIWSIFFAPLALIYRLAMALRNEMYRRGWLPSRRFAIPVIGVGNLRVGGTGKTPAMEYLIRLLADRHSLVALSRGYGRTTKGLLWAGPADDALTLGDEPYQLYRKYGDRIKVVVCERRAEALQALTEKYPDASAALLDDAYQHRAVTPTLNILLTEFKRPFYEDHVMPLGRLREARRGAARAHVVVVTKCPPTLEEAEREKVRKRIARYAPQTPVFFSYISYAPPRPFWGKVQASAKEAVLLSGIAHPDTFVQYAQTRFKVLRHFCYPDHHRYTMADLERIVRYLEERRRPIILLTTEKDMVKLLSPPFRVVLSPWACYYVPIEMAFITQGSAFDRQVRNAVVGKTGSVLSSRRVR